MKKRALPGGGESSTWADTARGQPHQGPRSGKSVENLAKAREGDAEQFLQRRRIGILGVRGDLLNDGISVPSPT